MNNKISQKNIDFFFSYQYKKNEKILLKWLNFINNLNLEEKQELDNLDYYFSKLDKIFAREINIILSSKKINKIWILLSWWIDSFILLYYIRKNFPDLHIYTFTFFPLKYQKEDEKELKKISKFFNTKHENIFKEVKFADIIANLKFIYSKSKKLIWDEGFLYNTIFLKEIQKKYDWKYLISWDWIDVLFWWLSMYKNSYLEQKYNNWETIKDDLFSNQYEKIYLFENIKNYDTLFFYKYWEYFWWSFLWKNYKEIINFFYKYYFKLDQKLTILKKQILFNFLFLIENRKSFIYESAKINWFNSLTPFIEKTFIKNVLELGISDKYLLDETNTKIIIRKLVEKINKENGINFRFLSTYKINYYEEFNKNSKYIIYIAKFLFDNKYITKNHYEKIPDFIKNSMWYENKIRIYLLLNLYFFIISRK